MPLTRSRLKKDPEDSDNQNKEIIKSSAKTSQKKPKLEKSGLKSIKHNSGFGRNSFERFGDDLTELLLSYLPIAQKFRFECLSKQWQRLIFNRQYRVVLDFYEELDRNTIKTPKHKQSYDLLFRHLFRKLKYVKDIECHHYFNTVTVESLINECQYIKKIAFNGNMKTDLFHQLFEKFGQRLVHIDLGGQVFIKQFDNIFRFTPNLKVLKINTNLKYLLESVLLNLVDIMFPLNINSELLTQFTDQYCKQIKTIHLRFDQNSSPEEINRCLTQISRYESLESFTLKLRLNKKLATPLDAGLKLIGNKCKNIRYFTLRSKTFVTNDDLLSVMNRFQSLIVLKLFIESPTNQSIGTVAELNSSKLKHLTLEFNGLNDETFDNIHIFLPNLMCFKSNDSTSNNLTDQTLNCFSKLQNIRLISLIGKQFTESGALQLIHCCPKINCLDINFDTTIKTIKSMCALANSHPKINYRLFINLWPNKSHLKFDVKQIPFNLSVIQK